MILFLSLVGSSPFLAHQTHTGFFPKSDIKQLFDYRVAELPQVQPTPLPSPHSRIVSLLKNKQYEEAFNSPFFSTISGSTTIDFEIEGICNCMHDGNLKNVLDMIDRLEKNPAYKNNIYLLIAKIAYFIKTEADRDVILDEITLLMDLTHANNERSYGWAGYFLGILEQEQSIKEFLFHQAINLDASLNALIAHEILKLRGCFVSRTRPANPFILPWEFLAKSSPDITTGAAGAGAEAIIKSPAGTVDASSRAELESSNPTTPPEQKKRVHFSVPRPRSRGYNESAGMVSGSSGATRYGANQPYLESLTP